MCHCRPCTHANVYDWLGWSPERGTQCWVQCWTGWRHRRRKIWRHFWHNTPWLKKADWSYTISRILWFIREPCTCAQCLKMRPKISYSLWFQGPIVLPPWMGATEMWVIRDVTVPCLYYGSISGGQVWPTRCGSPLSLACTACNMSVICPKYLYIQLWPLLWWTSCM